MVKMELERVDSQVGRLEVFVRELRLWLRRQRFCSLNGLGRRVMMPWLPRLRPNSSLDLILLLLTLILLLLLVLEEVVAQPKDTETTTTVVVLLELQ
jgi:hypothetical protein